ncbi:MAG: flagellin protein [Clostridium butyricum DORA_1]|nr:MAG: flagellin protein [Clostridium butyricum DORA_1]MDU1506665.1 flagellin [Clostridium butyricum]
MIINHNLGASNAIRQMNVNSNNASKSMQKLSSGLRINSAADDAAGLAISEKMRGQIRGLDQAGNNSQDAISSIQTAEGALSETTSILQRMRELAVQSATDTNTTDDRAKIQAENDELAKEITRISNDTEFNKQNLLAGGLNNTYQIGANSGQEINLTIRAMDSASLGVAGTAVGANLTASNTAQISGVADATKGLAAGNYSVIVTKTAAAITGLTAGNATVKTNAAGSQMAVTGTYTGVSDVASLVVKATGVDGTNQVNNIQYSTDNGVTWNGTDIGVTGSGSVTLGSTGISVAFDGTSTNAANDTWTFGATASKATAQLADAAGTTTIGSAVNIKNNQSTATIGDSTLDKQATISFNFSTLTASATNSTQIAISTVGSTAATFNPDGSVNNKAVAAAGIDLTTQNAASTAITKIDDAIKKVSEERSKLGAYQNRLEHTIANLGTSSENLTAAESRIRDVDMAKEMSTFSKNNILSQAAQAMLAQANSQPQQVLQLLR